MARAAAFTLVELLIVVAIVVMLAAVGLSQVAKSRMVAREQLALQSLKAVTKACRLFFVANQRVPVSLAELGAPHSDPPYLDPGLAQDPAVRQGYWFAYTAAGPREFLLTVNPVEHGTTGIRHFAVDESLRVHYTDEDRDAVPGTDKLWKGE